MGRKLLAQCLAKRLIRKGLLHANYADGGEGEEDQEEEETEVEDKDEEEGRGRGRGGEKR